MRISSSWRAPTRTPSKAQQAAVDRAEAYVEAGADMIFAEALTTLDEYRQFTRAVACRCSPTSPNSARRRCLPPRELARGRRAPGALSAVRVSRDEQAALAVYEAIRRDGTQKSVVPDMQTRAELYE